MGFFLGKYTEQAKLAAVEDYCTGQLGLKVVAQRHGVNVASLRKWAALYRVHGAAGVLEKRRSPYGVEFKLLVLQRMRDEELSYRQAAACFDIRNFNIIRDWERAFDEGGLTALSPYSARRRITMTTQSVTESQPQAHEDDARTRQELLDELNQLRMENAYLKKLDALVQASSPSARGNEPESCLS